MHLNYQRLVKRTYAVKVFAPMLIVDKHVQTYAVYGLSIRILDKNTIHCN